LKKPGRLSPWPAHGGELAALIRTHDWALSPLGPIKRWSIGLKTLVELVLAQQNPTLLLWGPDLVQIYNDACRELLGEWHPAALGRPARELGTHLWHFDPAMYERALNGETVALPDRRFKLQRQGRVEDAWFALAYVTARSADSSMTGVFVTAFDTTARQRARAERVEREKRYQLLFNSINEGFCVLETVREEGQPNDFRVVSVNPAFAAQSGVSDAVGKTLRELFPADPESWITTYDEVLRTNIATRFERKVAGQALWFDLYAFPVDDPPQDRIAVIFHDVSPRKRAEMALRESEARLSAILQHVPVGVGLFDTDGKYIVLNPIMRHYVGDTLPSRGGADRWRSYDREGRQLEPHEYPGARALRGEIAPPETDFLTHVEDEERWIRVGAVPLLRDGEVVGGISVALDTTDYKRADDALRSTERRVRALVEGIPQLVWSAHDDGRWSWSSPQWTRYTGQSESESHGTGWLEAVHPDDRAGVLEAWKRAPEAEHFQADFRLRRFDDGRYRWFQARATPVRNEKGRILEWLGTSTDVDDLRQLQESQKIMVAELQHRTRNLIMIVQSIAQQTMESSDSLATFATRFRGRLAALARVQRLLTRSGKARIDVGTLLRLELDALGANELSEHIHLDGPEVALHTSMVQTLALAIHELATNARKYGALSSHPGELEVTWRVDDTPADRPHLALEWIEKCAVPPRGLRRPMRRGYGRELIERALPYTLNAATSYVVGDEGVRCTIDIPLEERRPPGDGPDSAPGNGPSNTQANA
jgi:PAS domain S-box-containing protein